MTKESRVDPAHSVAPGLPETAFVDNSWNKSSGAPPVIGIKRGHMGFWPISTDATADDLNESMGVSEAQREAMHFGSMFGWGSPGADPKHQEMLLKRRRERSGEDK